MRKPAGFSQVSRGTLAALLLGAPVASFGQGFAGTGTVVHGNASIAVLGGVQTVSISGNSPVTTINWTPSDTASGKVPVDFLPQGHTVSYVGPAGAAGSFTVLNRIIPKDQTRSVAFNGTIDSTYNTRVWFYSPGGLLIGATASFNVGGLVLTAADPVLDANGDFITTSAGTDHFSFAGATGSTSAITIRPGASINALSSAQSNYIVAIAPQINQGGTIAVNGSAALVAAESASFAVDNQGLFNIAVTAGTTVAKDTFVHSGSTGGPSADVSGRFQRVYMVAVPKNNAISMAIAASGSIGFAIADAANISGNAVVLSAGKDIQDSGSGDPTVASAGGSGTADIIVGRGSYSSQSYVDATRAATVSDTASGGNPDLHFAADLTVTARSATVMAAQGTIAVAGNLLAVADATAATPAGSALVGVAGAGTAITAAGLKVSAQAPPVGAAFGQGGSAMLQSAGGTITASTINVMADAYAQGSNQATPTRGGTATLSVMGGGAITSTGGISVTAVATANNLGPISFVAGSADRAIEATGGTARITATGSNSQVSATQLFLAADAYGGTDATFSSGGAATGGSAAMLAQNGATIAIASTDGATVEADGFGGINAPGNAKPGDAGAATGGKAQIIADNATITLGQVAVDAEAAGGAAQYAGNGGAGQGGTALFETQGASGTITVDATGTGSFHGYDVSVYAGANGGNSSRAGFAGGNATGGVATFAVTGAGQAIAVTGADGIFVGSGVDAGNPFQPASGSLETGVEHGGVTQLLVDGGSATLQDTLLLASRAFGAFTSTASTGGTVDLTLTNRGVLDISGQTQLLAYARSGTGDAAGGTTQILANGPGVQLAAGGLQLQVDADGGTSALTGNGGAATGGTATVTAENGASIALATTDIIDITAQATGGNNGQPAGAFADAGAARGGLAQVIANDGTITPGGISLVASANGGQATNSGNGGSAIGGTVLVQTQGLRGVVNIAGASANLALSAIATGGAAQMLGAGGDATGGQATVETTGAGQSIGLDQGQGAIINADAMAGAGGGTGGGNAIGGSAQLLATGGAIAITRTSLDVEAGATGGADLASSGGNATGGTVRLAPGTGGTLDADGATTLAAFASGGNGGGSGGNALGGNIFVDLGNNAFNFAGSAAAVSLDASYSGGTGSVAGTAGSAGGVRVTDLGALSLVAAITLNANTPFYVQAGGGIDVSGGIGESGSGAYLHLWADDLGSGSGTVTLANGALNLPGSQIDIYYNPSALGTPTDFSAGIKAGTATAYQLVDDVDQLQLIGSFLSQNFALGRNIDASATQGWNGGAGFVPIGTYGSGAFTGNFDGLDHTITNLAINTLNDDAGLFGALGAGTGAQIIVRNIGLVNPQVTGASFVGALAGGVGHFTPTVADNISITNTYTGGGAVSGISAVGGMIGIINGVNNTTLTNIHTDTAVTGSGANVGGLAGFASFATITKTYATGTVTDLANGASEVGGLIGQMPGGGTLSDAYATGAVTTGTASLGVGGLVGGGSTVGVTITRAYATGSVTAGAGSSSVGGLVGDESITITQSWASGAVSAPGGTKVGGLVGSNGGSVTNSYWDIYSTGQASGLGANPGSAFVLNPVTSDPAQTTAANYAFKSTAYANFSTTSWVYDNASTRPVGAWETPVAQFGVAPVASAHQVQLIDANLAGSYAITQNIDMSGTGGTSDIWAPGGFMPLGGQFSVTPFSGTLAGGGHVLANLAMAPGSGFANGGLVQRNYGTIRDIGLTNVAITEDFAIDNGALVGVNAGRIDDSFATGTITLSQQASEGPAGGLVGLNADGSSGGTVGAITQSYASVAISGGFIAGGLVGDNEGSIDGSFANGAVSGSTAGGLVGTSNDASGPSVTNSYWDTQATGQSEGCGSTNFAGACGGVTALTTAQTLQSASFAGFAIDTQGGQGLPWRQYEGQTTPLLAAFLTRITVQPDSLTTQYNAQVPDVGVTTYGAQPALTFGTAQVTGLGQNAGTYAVMYAGGLYSNQLGYDFVASPTPGTLTITPAPLTLAATSDTRSYDATTGSQGTVQISGLFGQDSVSNLSQSFASPNALGSDGSTLVVNPDYAVNDGNGGGNYTITLQNATGTITPAPLTLAAVTDARVYDSTSNSAGTPQVSGLFGQDSVGNLSQSFASPNVLGSNGSTLVVNPGYVVNDGNDGGNYVVTSQSVPGTITPAPLGITYNANPSSSVYGDAITGLAGTIAATGLQGADTLASVTSGTVLFTTSATGQSNVGSYAVTGAGLAANSANYSFSFSQGAGNAGALTIGPRALTLTADPLSRVYGGTNPTSDTATADAAGLVNGDSIASETVSTPANAGSGVGSYALDGAAAQFSAGQASNYTITYATNANGLAITPAPLTLIYTASPASRSYGAADPELLGTATASGLVNNDTLDSVTSGSASFASAAASGAGVGSYAIIGSGLAGTSANYSYTAVQAPQNATALTITPASATITYTANPASAIYGNGPGGLTGSESASGLVNNETLAGVTSGIASYATTATSASGVGSYAVIGAGLAGSSGNYSFSFVQAPGNATALTITPRPITVTADPAQRQAGTTDLPLTYSVTGPGTGSPGLVNGDTLAGQLASTVTVTSPAGAYDIVQGSLAASANYQLIYVGNVLTLAFPTVTIAQVTNPIAANLSDQTDSDTPQERQKAQEAVLAALTGTRQGLHPPQITQSMINDRQVTTPPPVNEAVTSNGNPSLWSPVAP